MNKKFKDISIRMISNSDTDTDFVVSIRNLPEVMERFYSREKVTKESHLKYLEKAKESGDMIFIVEKNKKPIGQVAYFHIDMNNKRLEGGALLIDPGLKGLGIGAFVEYNMIDYAFSVLGVERIYAEVLESNTEVIKIHKKFGFKQEGFLKDHVIIDDKKRNVCYLGILKPEWDKSRFKKIFGERVVEEQS